MHTNHTELILDEVVRFLRSLHYDDRRRPATLLYNEGWLLRLVLTAAARDIRCLPHAFEPGARWFTKPCCTPPFRPRARGDRLGESVTHADGVIGHLVIGRSTRAGLHLADATQFIITEGKMFSGLSRGTTRAPGYDQAARNIACLALALSANGRPLESYRSLGFWVLAPHSQISDKIFACVCWDSVERKSVHVSKPTTLSRGMPGWVRGRVTGSTR